MTKKNKMIEFKAIPSGIKELRKIIICFYEPIFSFLLLLFLVSLIFLLNTPKMTVWYKLFLLLIYFSLAHKVNESLVTKLWNYVNLKRVPNRLTGLLGWADRLLYALFFAFQQYTLIGVWLGIKIASRLVEFKAIELTKDSEKDEEKIRPIGERKNIFILGNLISVILGIVAGYLIIALFNLPRPNLFK